MAVKIKKTGLTLVEILVVLSIIALLAGLLLPAMTVVKNSAKETKQKTQFSAINLALTTFKNDFGDYPPSDGALPPNPGSDYCGAQKLAEALLGWDLLGFHPNSDFRADGYNKEGVFVYDSTNEIFLDQRKSPYLDTETASAFKLGRPSGTKAGLFYNTDVLAPNTYVLCDVFSMTKVQYPNGKTVSAGSPILYYRANNSQKLIRDIYKQRDNEVLVYLKQQTEDIEQPLCLTTNDYEYFYEYIRDPKIEAIPQPYNADSYILISAGSDGIYGTSDDIRNFGN